MESTARMNRGSPLRGIVMVHMKTKVMRFPQALHGATEVPGDDSMILFSLGDRRHRMSRREHQEAWPPSEESSHSRARIMDSKFYTSTPGSISTVGWPISRCRPVNVRVALFVRVPERIDGPPRQLTRPRSTAWF
jgi:hypothetical protein